MVFPVIFKLRLRRLARVWKYTSRCALFALAEQVIVVPESLMTRLRLVIVHHDNFSTCFLRGMPRLAALTILEDLLVINFTGVLTWSYGPRLAQ